MLYKKNLLKVVKRFLEKSSAPAVIDPLFEATLGKPLLEASAHKMFCEELIPLARLLTPNLDEAKRLLPGVSKSPQEGVTQLFEHFGVPILLKGGHAKGKTILQDVFFDGKHLKTWKRKKNTLVNTHGSGCLLSSAIAAHLAKGRSLIQAIDLAETFFDRCLKNIKTLKKQHFLL